VGGCEILVDAREIADMARENMLDSLRQRARRVKVDLYALYLAFRDPRVPWYARVVAAGVVAYAFSPIDLIPDFIPVLGYLDDLILVPLGIVLALRMIPPEVMVECREHAKELSPAGRPTNWIAVGFIIGIWVMLAVLVTLLFLRVVIH
jgi:uncharacterized membrane protein YkvA (DUF1232 family)